MDVQEADLEEFIRRNIDIVFPDETLLVVGQQVVNEGRGRADLVALDAASSVVLIELKRDADDMRARAEQLEWQAIRYAANYALIVSPSALVQSLFAPYIERHREEFGRTELTPVQLAEEVLAEFLERNQVRDDEFNRRQRIVLVASSYNEEVLSASAWLSRDGVDIRCLFNDWGTKVTGWSAINIYEWAVLASADRTLDELRRHRMEELAQSAKEAG